MWPINSLVHLLLSYRPNKFAKRLLPLYRNFNPHRRILDTPTPPAGWWNKSLFILMFRPLEINSINLLFVLILIIPITSPQLGAPLIHPPFNSFSNWSRNKSETIPFIFRLLLLKGAAAVSLNIILWSFNIVPNSTKAPFQERVTGPAELVIQFFGGESYLSTLTRSSPLLNSIVWYRRTYEKNYSGREALGINYGTTKGEGCVSFVSRRRRFKLIQRNFMQMRRTKSFVIIDKQLEGS